MLLPVVINLSLNLRFAPLHLEQETQGYRAQGLVISIPLPLAEYTDDFDFVYITHIAE